MMPPDLQAAWDRVQGKLLFPTGSRTHPYYISTPCWIQSSAGIRALYLLCHTLNRLGFEAYITHNPHGSFHAPWTNPELKAPMLQKHHAEEHFQRGLTPILLYTEVVSGNPLQAPVVARWVMNFPGLLGGDTGYDPTELCFGYCRELAGAAGHPDQVLHMPTVDTRIFYPSDETRERKGCSFFAAKYQTVHGGELLPITKDCVEITRQLPDSPTTAEVADLLRRSEVFYTYENTALATEAVLCGCPAVFLPNPHLTEIIARNELGPEGYAWGAEPAELERAQATLAQGAINYLKTYEIFHQQLQNFIDITQTRAAATPYAAMLKMDSWPYLPPPRKPWYVNQPYRTWKEIRRSGRKLKRWFSRRFGQGEVSRKPR
ncbi:MAG: hypothetical protein NTW21_11850 [Verrucomicrobia bacterium]|nr:hypothetical protein [Verrucomicrobiota bacterium]